jgi:SynChlorMet cassette protein ScmC
MMILMPGKSEQLRKLCFVLLTDRDGCSQGTNALPPIPRPSNLPYDGWRMDNLWTLRVWSHPEVPDIVCELPDKSNHELTILTMGQALFPIYQAAIERGGVPLHAALLEHDGMGILIAARGGKGKTTCCRLAPRPWNARCDDETLVVRSESGLYNAHPFPTWSDYLLRRSEATWDVQRPTQLAAIFFLDQGESDQIVPLGEAEAAAKTNQSAGQVCGRMWRSLESCVQRENNLRLFDNACSLAKDVPAFALRASFAGRFWESIEKVLQDATALK